MFSPNRYLVLAVALLLMATPVKLFADVNLKEALGSLPETNGKPYFPSYLSKTVNHVRQGNCEKALSSISQILKTKQRLTAKDKVFLLKGICLQRQSKHADAARAFARSLRIRHANSDTLYFLGLTQDALKQPEAAQTSYYEALWFEKHSIVSPADIQIKLATIYEGKEDTEKVQSSLEAAANTDAESIKAPLKLADRALQDGDKDAALKWARTAHGRKPEDPHARLMLARALLFTADRAIHKEDIGQARDLTSTLVADNTLSADFIPQVYPVHVRALIANQDLDNAEKQLNRFSKKFPKNPEIGRLRQQLAIERSAEKIESARRSGEAKEDTAKSAQMKASGPNQAQQEPISETGIVWKERDEQ